MTQEREPWQTWPPEQDMDNPYPASPQLGYVRLFLGTPAGVTADGEARENTYYVPPRMFDKLLRVVIDDINAHSAEAGGIPIRVAYLDGYKPSDERLSKLRDAGFTVAHGHQW